MDDKKSRKLKDIVKSITDISQSASTSIGDDNRKTDILKFLKSIEEALTGLKVEFNLKPVVGELERQTSILNKLQDERSLLQSLSENIVKAGIPSRVEENRNKDKGITSLGTPADLVKAITIRIKEIFNSSLVEKTNNSEKLVKAADSVSPANTYNNTVNNTLNQIGASTETSKPVETTIEPVKPVVPTIEPVKPVRTRKKSKPVETTIEPVKPVRTRKKSKPVETTIEPVKPVVPTIEPVKPVVPTIEPVKPVETTIEPVVPTIEPVKPVETTIEPVVPTIEPVKPVVPTKTKKTARQQAQAQIDISPLIAISNNAVSVLTKLLQEQVLTRKITEGSLEYDKKSTQYRNISGRTIESILTGKTIRKGGYVDFETASDRLTGQSQRVREAEKNKPSISTPPSTTTSNIAARPNVTQIPSSIVNILNTLPRTPGINPFLPSNRTKEKKQQVTELGTLSDLATAVKERIKGISSFFTNKPEQVKIKKKQTGQSVKDSFLFKEPALTSKKIDSNVEADNIQTPQEILADTAKNDLEITKEIRDLNKEQLAELKKFGETISPTVRSNTGKTSTSQSIPATENKDVSEEDGGLGLGGMLAGVGALAKRAGKALGRGARAVGRGALRLGKGIAGMAASPIGRVAGTALAVGTGAYTAYKGYTGAEEEKQAAIQEVDQKVQSGEITPEQALEQKKEIAAKTTENKGGAVGKGAGLAAGAIGGGIAGAKVGATIGTFLGGPIGTALGAGIGTLAGGAIGAISGSSVGQNIGGLIGKGVAGVKSFFGAEDIGSKTEQAVTGKAQQISTKFDETEFAKKDPKTYKEFLKYEEEVFQKIASKNLLDNTSNVSREKVIEQARAAARIQAIQKFEPEIKAAIEPVVRTEDLSNKSMVGGTLTGGEKEKSIFEKATSSVKSIGSSISNFFTNTSEAKAIPQPAATNVIPVQNNLSTGRSILATTMENQDLERSFTNTPSPSQSIISNNVNNVNTTSYIPIKPTPRAENYGSALDRYTNRIAVF